MTSAQNGVQGAPTRDAVVSLREVTGETVRTICELQTSQRQRSFVTPNAISIAEAHFEPNAWYRAIYADETPVGFVMLYDEPEESHYHLWRFMIDARYQGLGYGKRALELVIAHVKTRPGATSLELCYVPAEDGPGAFYQKFGFVDTGAMEEDQRVARLDFA